MTFRVNLSARATSDVDAILRWIEDRSPAGAAAWYQRWLEALETISQRADGLGLAPESEDHPEAIRQIIFKTKHGRPYRALFALHGAEAFILHIRGPGQKLLGPEELK